ncbi:3-hydroxy-2-methylbutyryl-CoA dehydrogenase [Frankia sp. R43]|uniref:SDR family NAD(P)-dependent oxidoreductase n=1 Tax=Frankia sp. R43 TaxID=269536 RepID=UPI0006C9F67A|nr:SDR family NAD(P)-dependent oxidoreductase [Frankia sp. R43]KPM51745.1 3-hydroxy-2-methylbutyryl-CoA dehydrogenase [Frankia sp. R43]
MLLNGTSALVTGGASGLGLGTARVLLDRGAAVTIVDLASSPGRDVAAELGVRFVAADITDTDQFDAALDAAAADGPLRGVVHCAGRGGDRLRVLDRAGNPGALDSYAEIIRINLVGTYNVVRLAAARMARNAELPGGDRGAIVLTASVAAFEGQIGQTAYASAKAGVRGLTIVAARDLASWAIRVNTIAPGVFETPMLGRLRDDIRDGLAAGVPHPKRLGTPADFGRLAADLLENGYLNGEVIRLDGALRMAPR